MWPESRSGRGSRGIAFARRFAAYKRADLIFADEERLAALVNTKDRLVQLVFAGKAHPADDEGKRILQRVFTFSRDPEFEGRIATERRVATLELRSVCTEPDDYEMAIEPSEQGGRKIASAIAQAIR